MRMRAPGSHGAFTYELARGTEDLFENRSDGYLRQFTGGGRTDAHADVIVFGHTHVPYHRIVDGVHVVNTGSVGCPRDADPRAGYCILTVEGDSVSAEQVRVSYDVELTGRRLVEAGLLEYFAGYLRTGGRVPEPAPIDERGAAFSVRAAALRVVLDYDGGMIARRVHNRAHYAWIIAAVTFLILIFAAGFRSTPSVLMVPLQHEFGWDRASISLAVAVNLVLYGLSDPFAAALMLRFGIKRVTVSALLTIAIGAALTTQMRTTWQLVLLWGVVIGIATGSVTSGWLTDRWNSRRLLCWYYGLRGLSLFLLPYALRSTGLMLILFVVFYGLDWVATVPPTAALATQLFGREMGGIVYGWVFASHQLGAAFAAYGAGVIRTWTGDYLLAFVTAGALCLLAAASVLTIPAVGRRQPISPEPRAAPA